MLSVFIRWVVWFGRLFLVVSVAMYRCALMYRLIKLHTRGCVYTHIYTLYIYENNTAHCYNTTPHGRENTTKSSAPEDGHMVARNILRN